MNDPLEEFGLLEEEDLTDEDMQNGRYLTFLVGQEAYAIEIQAVEEIVGLQKISDLPDAPAYVKGVINLRGSIIPVIDMCIRLKKPPVDYDDRTCIIIINVFGVQAGLIVGNVSEVVSIPDENVSLPPDSHTGYQNRYIKGVGKYNGEIKLLLDCERLFSDEELKSFDHAEEQQES